MGFIHVSSWVLLTWPWESLIVFLSDLRRCSRFILLIWAPDLKLAISLRSFGFSKWKKAFRDYSLGSWVGPHEFHGSWIGHWFRHFQWLELQVYFFKEKMLINSYEYFQLKFRFILLIFMSLFHFNHTKSLCVQQSHHNLSFYLFYNTHSYLRIIIPKPLPIVWLLKLGVGNLLLCFQVTWNSSFICA